MAQLSSSAVSHPSRLILVAVFLPAFPLLLAHGIVSKYPVPAVGLAPLAVSAVSSVLLLRLRRDPNFDEEEDDDGAATPTADDDHDDQLFSPRRRAALRRGLTHPVTVFAFDAVLAAAFMIVLVFTWIAPGLGSSLSMLAAYATIPLLVSFALHFLLALHAFYYGLALRDLYQWLAWRAVPPDCPNCSSRLRPSLPEFPWLKRFRRRDDYAPVLADDAERYRDEPDEPQQATVQPEAVEVRRKDRKGKSSTPAPAEEATPWGA